MNVSSALAETNFVVYGNNGSAGTDDSDFPLENLFKNDLQEYGVLMKKGP